MVRRRRAIATTLTSVVVFTVLLVSNALIFQGENANLGSVREADLENQEAFIATTQSSLSAYSALAQGENLLVTQPPRCSGWDAYSDSIGEDANYSGVIGAVHYSESVISSYAQDGPSDDNLSLISPFGGFQSGSLNLVVEIDVREAVGVSGGLPSYHKDEVHYVHIPMALGDALSICAEAMAELGALPPPMAASDGSCPSLAAQIGGIASKYGSLAAADGLGFSLSTSPLAGSPCGLSYTVTLSQQAEGVSGPFEWSTLDGGALP